MKLLIDYIKNKKEWLSFIDENSEYFRSGRYIYDKELRYIYLIDNAVISNAIELFGTNDQSIIKKTFSRVI